MVDNFPLTSLGSDLKNSSHLWWMPWVRLRSCALRALFVDLTKQEQERAQSYILDRDQRRYIASRGLLRRILSQYVHLESNRWEIISSEYGRPQLNPKHNPYQLDFNITHTQRFAGWIVTTSGPCGIDIENTTRFTRRHSDGIDFLSDKEKLEHSRLPRQVQPDFLCRSWTLKEAYLKALGTGLGTEPSSLNIQQNSSQDEYAAGQVQLGQWRFEQKLIAPSHYLAAAVKSSQRPGAFKVKNVKERLGL